jgi:hypothetical protein
MEGAQQVPSWELLFFWQFLMGEVVVGLLISDWRTVLLEEDFIWT